MAVESTIITPRRHRATFEGRHNSVKTKTLVVLYHRQFTEGLNTGLTAKQIALLAGVNLGSVLSRAGSWYRWGYIGRRAKTDGNGRPAYFYSLAGRGKNFIESRVPQDVLNRYIKEIREHQNKQEEVRDNASRITP